MATSGLLKELASRVLEVDVDASEKEIKAAYRDKSSDWHPDVSDDPDAQDKFIAAGNARDVLLGDMDFSDPAQVKNTKDSLSILFSEEELNEIDREKGSRVNYRSEAETRSDPQSYTREDFVGATPDDKREMMKDIALGVETVVIYESVEGMYLMGYDQDDFFNDVNDYIGEASEDQIDFEDYYEATKDSLRDEVTKELFINSCEKVQDNLQSEYGEGTNIREVARIIAHFMVQGGINIGDLGRFVGRSDIGDDPRFTRSHPLGRHGRGRRGDPRFTRGGRRYSRR